MDELIILKEELKDVDREELGNVIYEAFMEDDNLFCDIGGAVIYTFNVCETEKEKEIANRMLAAICGYRIETLLNRMEDD